MINLKQFKAVCKFEYIGYLKSKSFIISTLAIVSLLLIASAAPQISGFFSQIFSGGSKTSQAAFASNLPGITPELLNEYLPSYEWSLISDKDGFEQFIENGSYEAVIYYTGGLTYDFYAPGSDFQAFSAKSGADALIMHLNRQALLETLEEEQRESIEAFLNLSVEGELHTVGVNIEESFWNAYVLEFLLYMVTIIYGQFILTSIVTEKSSKAMELLVTSAKPLNFLFGKVIGVGAVALTQVGAILLTVIISIKINSAAWEEFAPLIFTIINSTVLSAPILIYFILFFILGYFMYAFIYAALGSSASRMEDVSSISIFPTMLVVISFIVAITGMTNVNASYMKVLSFIPLFSPMVMFTRICLGVAKTWEAIVSLALLIAGTYVTGWAGAKIYQMGVLMYGKPFKVKDLFGLLRG